MAQPRPSSFGTTPEQEEKLNAAQALHTRLDKANLDLLKHVADFHSNKFDPDDAEDVENIEPRDPAIVAANVGAQVVRVLNTLKACVVLITFVHLTVIPTKAQVPVSGAKR